MSRFNPYSENGGSILAISTPSFSIVASDTRQTEGFSIQTRYKPKCYPLTDQTVIAVQGFTADSEALVKRIKARIEWYKHHHKAIPALPAIARLVQTILYGKRFFPFYSYVILGGIDRDGAGAVYSFDPVGSYERESCRCAGAAQDLIQPFLDNQIKRFNIRNPSAIPVTGPTTGSGLTAEELAAKPFPQRDIPLDEALKIVTDAFTGATERHIEVGDGLEIFVIRKRGDGDSIELHQKPLKRD